MLSVPCNRKAAAESIITSYYACQIVGAIGKRGMEPEDYISNKLHELRAKLPSPLCAVVWLNSYYIINPSNIQIIYHKLQHYTKFLELTKVRVHVHLIPIMKLFFLMYFAPFDLHIFNQQFLGWQYKYVKNYSLLLLSIPSHALVFIVSSQE